MSAIEETLRHEIVKVGQLLYQRGLIVAGDGNISARLSDELILMTPSSSCKGMLAPEDMVIVDLEGRARGQRRPSSELQLHLAVYRQRPDIQAVVHAHPSTAVACTLVDVRLDECVLPEAIITLGAVPTVPFALSGTRELDAAIAPFLPYHNAILLSHHGALTVGRDLMQAFHRMEQVEQVAKILFMARQLGGARPLPPEQLARLEALRIQLGGHPQGGCVERQDGKIPR